MSQSITFAKMHALGNDFVIVETNPEKLGWPITSLANRYIGIGFDQLLCVEQTAPNTFFCHIYNADGSEAEQCGNGLRCVARYLHEKGLADTNLEISTKAGTFPLHIRNYQQIELEMGVPLLIPSTAIALVNLGNPHAILAVTDVKAVDVAQEGARLSGETENANIGFMQVMSPEHIFLRTYERGVGETHACGSNACAAVVVGISNGWLHPQVQVEYRYGLLKVEWQGLNHPVHLIGPATFVFNGLLNEAM